MTGKSTPETAPVSEGLEVRPEPAAARQRPGDRRAGILIIVPAHNEADSIADVLRDLAAHVPDADVLVVDDGSTDATADRARAAGADVARLACNLGVGGAVQTGYLHAAERGYEAAVQFDGDGQHRANRIAGLLEPIHAGEADLVVGSRLLGGLRFRFHPLRFLGNRLLSLLVSAICRRRMTDPTSGFRAAGPAMIRFFAKHYPQAYLGDTAEALVWAARAGMRLTEVPVRMNQRAAGVSATGSFKGLWLTLRIVLALLVDCLEPKVTDLSEEGR